MTKKSQVLIYLVMFMISATEMAGDMFAPSLPSIKDYYNIDEATAQLLIGINLFGVGLSALIYGPLSDKIGRRRVVLAGMALFALGGLACIIKFSFISFLIARFIQGLGAGCAVVVGFSSVHDIFKGNSYAAVLSKIGMVLAISPGLAPIIGGYIAVYWGWHIVLWVIGLVSTGLWILLLKKMPETKKINYKHASITFFSKEMLVGYASVLQNKQFIMFMLIQVLAIASLWGEMANLPFVYIVGMNLATEHYGYYVAIGVTAFIIGTKINQAFVESHGMEKMLSIGLSLRVLSGLFLMSWCFWGHLTPALVQLITFPGAIGMALILGNATACAMNAAEGHTGSAAALIASLEMVLGSLAVIIVGYFYNETITPIVIGNLFCTLLGICFLLINNLLSKKS